MTNFERTVAAAEERAKRKLVLSQDKREMAKWYLDMVDRAEPLDLTILGKAHGSLTGLVLAAEGVTT